MSLNSSSRYFLQALLLASAALLSPLAHAEDPARGKELSAVCSSCHGELGDKSVTPDIPMMAGQSYTYLVRSLKDYRSGARQNLIMASFVKDLSDQDIEDISAWYSGQEPALHTPTP